MQVPSLPFSHLINPLRSGFRLGGMALLSSSPEQFLEVCADGHVTISPIKRTGPRDATMTDGDALKWELRSSADEKAENVMIVDLVRNNLACAVPDGSGVSFIGLGEL